MSDWLRHSGKRIIAQIKALDPCARPEVWPFQIADGEEGWIVDAGNNLPARKVRSGWQSRSIGSFISRHSSAAMEWESRAEYAALLVLEYEWSLRRMRTQPLTVIHRNGRKISKTYPDIEIVTVDRQRQIIQVKSDRDLQVPEVNHRLNRDRVIFESSGWKYDVWKESEVMKEPRHSTLNGLHYFRRHKPDENLIDRVRAILTSNQGITMGRLMDILETEVSMEATVLPLVIAGVLRLDTSRPIASGTPVLLAV